VQTRSFFIILRILKDFAEERGKNAENGTWGRIRVCAELKQKGRTEGRRRRSRRNSPFI
jgi:hypothetical protein